MEKKSIFLKLWFPPPIVFFIVLKREIFINGSQSVLIWCLTSCLDKVRRVADFKKQFNSSLDKLSV